MDNNAKETTTSGYTEKVYEHEAGIKQITSFNADRFHVKASLEEWINTHYDTLETVVVDESDFPRFEFNVKVHQQHRRRDVYIPCCAVARLKQLHEHQRAHKITYSAPSLIKFAFNYVESEHWLKAYEIPKHKRTQVMYREPYDEHVAQLVVNGYHTCEDALVEMSDLDVIYYFLSVLKSVNCAVLNKALEEVRKRNMDSSLYQSAILPGKAPCSSGRTKYYTLYAEIIHFLGLMAPPMCIGDNKIDIVEKVKKRNVEQTKILCGFVGITNYGIVDRGREWFKVVKFFDANPDFCATVGTAIIEAQEDSLTVIEKQTLEQVRNLWMWRKMRDFFNCYSFATNRNTEVHKMDVIASQCDMVQKQYQKLVLLIDRGGEKCVPFMSFYMQDKQLQGLTNVEIYPELFYAAVSTSVKTKRGNSGWEQFVATRPAKIPRAKIEELLAVKLVAENDVSSTAAAEDEDEELERCKSSLQFCSSDGSWHHDDLYQGIESACSYFQTDFNYRHFDNDNMEDIISEGVPDVSTNDWGATARKNSKDLCYDADIEWDICDQTENGFPKGSGTFNLETHLIEATENNNEQQKKSMEELVKSK